MKHFTVTAEVLSGIPMIYVVHSDGGMIEGSGGASSERYTVILGYSVSEYDEAGLLENVEYFAVSTDMATLQNNAEEVLAKIKEIYSTDNGWQNDEW